MDNDNNSEIKFISLINTLVVDGIISNEYEDILSEILFYLREDTTLYSLFSKSIFFKTTVKYLLRSRKSHIHTLEFLTEIFDHIKVPELFYTKKFCFFITDKLYEYLYDNYIPNIRFVSKLISHINLELLYSCGYFCILNSIIDVETCKLYNNLFNNIVYTKNIDHKQDTRNKDIFYEVERKYFDNEIVFNTNNIFKYKVFRKENSGSAIHNKIYKLLENTSLYNLLECDILHMDSVINYKRDNACFLQFLDLENVLENVYNKNILFIRYIRLNCTDKEYYNELESRGYFKRITKLLDEKDMSLRYEVVLTLATHNDLEVFINEKRIRNIFEVLEYWISECICAEDCQGLCTLKGVLDLLYRIYVSGRQEFFYKMSYLILLNELRKRTEHEFIEKLFVDVDVYLRKNKNNISRMLFPYNKKGRHAREMKEENDLFDI